MCSTFPRIISQIQELYIIFKFVYWSSEKYYSFNLYMYINLLWAEVRHITQADINNTFIINT